jgi:Cu2+-exporting ATPase
MNVMLLSVSVWSGAEGSTRELFHWISALIAVPAIAYAGQPFFHSAWRALRAGQTNMDVPISLGVLIATGLSLYETARHGEHAWFDGALMLLTFLLIGRVLDAMMRDRARSGVDTLLSQAAQGATVMRADGTLGWIAAEALDTGMVMRVAAGERLAADGEIVAGNSRFDQSLLTGESAPVVLRTGDTVLAGTLNLAAPVDVRVSHSGRDTTLAEIARLMDASTQDRSRYVRIADRAARLYAPAVHLLAALTVVGWLVSGATLYQALVIGVAVLIITCPCALGLAVPVAQVVASGSLMRAGIMVKDGSAFERLAAVDRAVLDKTGTLTVGRPCPIPRCSRRWIGRGGAGPRARVEQPPSAVAGTCRGLCRPRHRSHGARGGARDPRRRVFATWRASTWLCADPKAAREGWPRWSRSRGGPRRLIPFTDRLRPGRGCSAGQLAASESNARSVGRRLRRRRRSRQGDRAGRARQRPPRRKAGSDARLRAAGRRVLMVGDGPQRRPGARRGGRLDRAGLGERCRPPGRRPGVRAGFAAGAATRGARRATDDARGQAELRARHWLQALAVPLAIAGPWSPRWWPLSRCRRARSSSSPTRCGWRGPRDDQPAAADPGGAGARPRTGCRVLLGAAQRPVRRSRRRRGAHPDRRGWRMTASAAIFAAGRVAPGNDWPAAGAAGVEWTPDGLRCAKAAA